MTNQPHSTHQTGKLPGEMTQLAPDRADADTIAPVVAPDLTALEPPQPLPAPKPRTKPIQPTFDAPIVLQQSRGWSRAIVWTLIGMTTLGIGWASIAEIEEAVPAIGKLEPAGTVKDIQIPTNGVVKTVHVKDGQTVKQGDLLLTIDPTTATAQLRSLQQVRTTLMQENQFYEAQLKGNSGTLPTVSIPPQFLGLTKSRAALAAENQLIRVQLDGAASTALTLEQQERLRSNQQELSTRSVAAQLEGNQLQEQRHQTDIKLATARKTLAMNQQILQDVEPLAQTGAISKIQYLKQQQEVEANQSEVSQLEREQQRLAIAIQAAQTKQQSTVAVDRKDLTRQLSENHQRIAEIDSQITKAIVENNKKIAEIDSQITGAQQTLKYGELRAPVGGTVFDLKAKTPGFVATTTEPVLKIVPNEALVAKVSITNQDIGFVREGMPVDVRIDSFPFSEFGDVKGKLVWIGSDALPPTQIQPFYTFPAKIQLDRQSLQANGRPIRLQSGMSLSANIKIRKRTVMSIFTDQFAKVTDSLKQVR